MPDPSRVTLRVLLPGALGVILLAAGLEGAVVPGLGGPVVALAAALGAVVAVGGVERPGRWAAAGAALVGLAIGWAVAPVPEAVRAVVAPGQAAWLARVAPEAGGDLSAWLDALTRYDVLAAVGLAEPWAYDPLADAVATRLRPGGVAPERLGWALAQLGGMLAMFGVGARIGRSARASRWLLLGLLGLAVVESVFGIANRNGPSTGIGDKVYYLGSATGTFVNRGHFGAFLALGLAAAWGLAASLFPLEADEVTRHRRHRKRSSQPPSVLEAAGTRVPRLFVLALAAGVVGVGMVASQSRGPLLGFAVAAALVGGLALRWRGERFHLVIGLGVPAAVGVLSVVGYGLRGAFGRFAELATGGGESLSSRLSLWREGLSAWLQAPVFGGGPGSWRLVWGVEERGAHLYDFQHAHSELVEQLAEVGVVGTAGWALLAGGWLWGCLAGFRGAEHDDRTAAGVAGLVGALAVGVQSLADFPLHTPGVGLAAATAAGLGWGGLRPREAPRAGPAGAVGMALVCLATAGLGLAAAVADRGVEATRAQRVGELPRVWFALPGDAPDAAAARARRDQALAAALATPMDPWTHALHAREEARVAWFLAREGGPHAPVEEAVFAADLALTRAERLRPRDGRLALSLARTALVLAPTDVGPDAWRERATHWLARAVALDPWRAAEAFSLADALPTAALERIAAGAPADGVGAARVAYELGQALARRGQPDAALVAWRRAVAADPGFGPAHFQIGVVLRGRGEAEAARAAFRALLGARERPGGMEGWALLFLGEVDAAEARLRRVVADAPGNRWAWEGLAQAAAERRDPVAELAAWRRVLDLAPGDARARERVATLEAGVGRK